MCAIVELQSFTVGFSSVVQFIVIEKKHISSVCSPTLSGLRRRGPSSQFVTPLTAP